MQFHRTSCYHGWVRRQSHLVANKLINITAGEFILCICRGGKGHSCQLTAPLTSSWECVRFQSFYQDIPSWPKIGSEFTIAPRPNFGIANFKTCKHTSSKPSKNYNRNWRIKARFKTSVFETLQNENKPEDKHDSLGREFQSYGAATKEALPQVLTNLASLTRGNRRKPSSEYHKCTAKSANIST